MVGVEAYTGTLADAGLQPLSGRAPEIFAELLHPARSERYLLATTPVKAVMQGNGEFVITLQPNDQIIGSNGYRLYAAWLDGGREMARRDLWEFYARSGGGRIADMMGAGAFAPATILYQPARPDPWPRGVIWWNSLTDDVKRME